MMMPKGSDWGTGRLPIISPGEGALARNYRRVETIVRPGERVPNGHPRCCSWGCCYQIFNVLKLFHFETDRN